MSPSRSPSCGGSQQQGQRGCPCSTYCAVSATAEHIVRYLGPPDPEVAVRIVRTFLPHYENVKFVWKPWQGLCKGLQVLWQIYNMTLVAVQMDIMGITADMSISSA